MAGNLGGPRELRRTLGLFDLVLLQILLVIGMNYAGTAAKLGSAHTIYWLLSMLLFYVPQATVVGYLSKNLPLEGGLYQWAKLVIGPMAGFMTAWNLWIAMIVVNGALGLQVVTYLFYLPWIRASSIHNGQWLTLTAHGVLVIAMVAINLKGLAVGKWLHNIGAILTLGVFGILVWLWVLSSTTHVAPSPSPLSTGMNVLSLVSINLFSKLALNALSGVDNIAVFAGESRDPSSMILKSAFIAGPLILLAYISATSSLLAYTQPAEVDLIGPIPQALERASVSLGRSFAGIATMATLGIMTALICQSCAQLAECARLPMVAGWDGFVPPWLSSLNRNGAPFGGTILVGAAIAFFGVIGVIGVQDQEALQLFFAAAYLSWGAVYLVLFLIPLVSRGKMQVRPTRSTIVAGICGLAVTCLALALDIFPIIEVKSPLRFAVKVGGTFLFTNSVGFILYRRGRWKASTNLIR